MRQGKRINLLLNLEAAQAYYFHGGNWYHRLKKFPAVLIDKRGYVRFETENEYHNTPGVDISTTSDNQVHVPLGISSLPGYHAFTEAEEELIFVSSEASLSQIEAPTNEKALRRKREINALVRNQQHVREIKDLYENKCQICGERIQVRPGRYYSEVHHIKPLGQEHDGADTQPNMLCVCPNHHTMLDFFAIRLDVDALLLNRHPLDATYVAYHNERAKQFNPNSVLTLPTPPPRARSSKQVQPFEAERPPRVIEESEKTKVSERMISFIHAEIGVPKPGHIRLMAPLTYDESVRLYNAVLQEFPGALYNVSTIAGRDAIAAAANSFLTKIGRVK